MLVNTSISEDVTVDIFNHNDIPLAATYTSESLPIDITDYKFEFILRLDGKDERTYTIDAGVVSTEFLEKNGADNNILNMEKMFEDIRDKATHPSYKLLQKVTANGKTFVYITYTINAKRY